MIPQIELCSSIQLDFERIYLFIYFLKRILPVSMGSLGSLVYFHLLKKHASGWIGYAKLPLVMNECIVLQYTNVLSKVFPALHLLFLR